MRYLKTYKIFEAAKTGLTKEQAEFLNKYTKGTWTYNPQTGLVDVDGNFYCEKQGLSDFKGVRFGKVGRFFWCNNNQLTSLEGAPREVGVDFICDNNQLTSLEGAPEEVGAGFSCVNNQLTTLEGAPQEVGGSFWCQYNGLTTLEGAPQEVGGDFICDNNGLITLEGAPQKVGESFYCSDNQLTTLEGAPQKIGGSFWCKNNQLTTLEGAPQKIGGSFWCKNNPVSEKTLESIFRLMKKGKSYLKAVESLWTEIPVEDQILLYRPEFDWVGIKGLLKIFQNGSKKAQEIILKFLSPEALNPEIQKDPAGMVMKLKGVWNDESFRETRTKLVWPKGYEEEADLVGDLDDVGF